MKRNETIIVTGANGLAGSAVVDHLRKNLFTCVIPLTRDSVDLRRHELVCEVFERAKPAYVFHAAATVYGIVGNMQNQGKSAFDNTMINTCVIDAAHRAGAKKIIAMGTNAIYPASAPIPYREETIFNGRPHAAESAYGHAKRGMLAMLEAYRESYGLDYTYLVSGNLYGPNDSFNTVTGHVLPSLIAKFYDAAMNGGDVMIWGNGSPRRDFLYSYDLARIVQLFIENEGHFGSTSGPINIGSGKVYTIREIAEMLSAISGVQRDRVLWNREMPNGRLDCTSDLSRLDALGFEPEHSIEAGLINTWSWYCAGKRLKPE